MFQIESYVKGNHKYKDMWARKVSKKLRCHTELENIVDKYVVCILLHDKVVGHFTKTIFYFLRGMQVLYHSSIQG